MTFMAVEDSFYDHAKTVALFDGPCPGPAVALWTLAGSWSSRHLQNGFVPNGRVRLFGLDKRAAKELVRVGLWNEVEGGYQFHEWLERNPSRDAVEAKRAKTAERVARFRQKRLGNAPATPEQRAGNDPCNAVTASVSNADGDALVRVPPDPRPQTPSSSIDEDPPTPTAAEPPERGKPRPEVSEVFEHWRSTLGKTAAAKLDPKRRKRIEWALKAYDLETVKRCIDGYATSPWHRGTDPKSTRPYDDLELWLRDAAHVEAGLAMADGGGRRARGPLAPATINPDEAEASMRRAEDLFGPIREAANG